MIIALQIAFLLSLVVLLHQRTATLLTYFQQEEYDGSRFVSSWQSVHLFDIKATLTILSGGFLIAVGAPQSLILIVLTIACLIIFYTERQYRYKKPLAKTARAMRIFRITFMVSAILAFGIFWSVFAAAITLQLLPLIMILVNASLQPMQNRINEGFISEASAKLKRLDPVRIGITGSFGKTTVKHMLAEIMEASAPVYYSRGSINTVLGHTRHIRERLQHSHRYFIAEMGAYGIGSIKRLCDFINPTYGIITAVGDAHTERFGSREIIAQAKSELAEEVCKDGGLIVLNEDVLQYEPFKALKERFPTKIISVGGDKADATISSHKIEGGVWSITLHSKDRHFADVSYQLPLLGDHNVMNSALAVTLALMIDGTIASQIPYFTKTIAQIPHRLQKLETPGSALILDDAYNSNEHGFMSAVASLDELAKERDGRRILVTPGIAELGLEHDAVHTRLGNFSTDKCDLIYVVNPSRIESFVDAAKTGSAEVITVNSLAEARRIITANLKPEDVVLYENDLPDLLEETRLL